MSVWVYDDGGRADAGFRGSAGDCVPRAIAIATGLPYLDVYRALGERIGAWSAGRSRHARTWTSRSRGATARNGTPKPVIRSYLTDLGWTWHPTMHVGSGTTVHLRAEELPVGCLVVSCSRHVVAVIDGVVHDTADPARDGTRAVYGFWTPA
jgi:hypothetical protein